MTHFMAHTRRLYVFLSLGLALAAFSLAAFPAPQQAEAAPVAPGLSLSVAGTNLLPAQGGYALIGGGYPLNVMVTLDGDPLEVFWAGHGYFAPFAFDFDAAPGFYLLEVQAFDTITGASLDREVDIVLQDYSYPLEQVALPFKLVPLLDRDLNVNEVNELNAIYAMRTRPSTWDWPFDVPVPAGLITSRFGGDRTYNGGLWAAHHTGTDFRRAVSEPVHATAAGRVAAARFFDIRGNVVIIDHGYGVFSQYAHLSESYVQVGEYVRQGQLIASAGATGRTNGPHLHFEIIVNGITIDPIQWLALYPDFIPPREAYPDEVSTP